MSNLYGRTRRILTGSLLAVLTTTSALRAQGLGSSPYSAFGLGERYEEGNVTNQGMGGVGVSNASPFFLNLQNPALLARRTRFTVFEVGLIGQSRTLSQSLSTTTQTQQNTGGNLNYLALAFPANSRWNIAISLRPYTYVDYTTRQLSSVIGTPYSAQFDYSGRGGLNKASLTNGVRVTKNTYLGVEGSFLFGNVTYSSTSRVLASTVQNSQINRINRINYSDVIVRFGAAWRPKLGETWSLNVGATYDPGLRVKSTQTDVFQQTTLAGQNLSAADTIGINATSRTRLPQQARFGITLERANTLVFGVDVGMQRWSEFTSVDGQTSRLKDVMTAAAGIEYTPKVNSSRYRDLVTYRAGFQYNQQPFVVNGQSVHDVNGSIGLSLPVGAYRVNHVSLALIVGQRGALTGGLVRENYARLGIGFSLNDWWFRKPVID